MSKKQRFSVLRAAVENALQSVRGAGRREKGACSDDDLEQRRTITFESLEGRVLLSWTGATSGTTNDAAHDYNNAANWAGGVVDDSFAGISLIANTTLYLSANRTTVGTGLNLGYNGNFDLTIVSNSSTTRTLALAGDVTGDFGGPANARTVTLGSTTNPVTIGLGAVQRTVNVADSTDMLNLTNTVTGTGALYKAGAGTLSLLSADTYTGGTQFGGGIVSFANGSLGAGNISFLANTTLQWNGHSQDISGKMQAGIPDGVMVRFGISNDVTFASPISGLGSIKKGGSGVLTLNAANTFSGTARSITGTLKLGNSLALQNSTLDLNSADAGLFSFGTRTTATLGGLQGSRGLALVNDSSSPVTLTVGGSSPTTYGGVMSGTGSLVRAGTGTLTLAGANTYAGVTSLLGGTLVLADPQALQNSTVDLISSGSGVLGFGSLNVATLGGLQGSRDLALISDSGGEVVVGVGGNGANTTYSGVLNGPGSMIKQGAGTLILQADSEPVQRLGSIEVQAGTLAVDAVGGGVTNANLGGSATPVTVRSGGRLGLRNSPNLPNPIVLDGGTIAYEQPGTTSVAKLSGPVTVAGSGTLDTGAYVVKLIGGLAGDTLTKAGTGALTFTAGSAFDATLAKAQGTINANDEMVAHVFESVYNNVALSVYKGAMKGTQAVLDTGGGNDWDQAAALVDLLTGVGVSAQVVYGNVKAPWADVMRWLGTTEINATYQVLSEMESNAVPTLDGNQLVTDFTFNHAWVRVTLPSGATVDLDTSWKSKDRQPGISGILDAVPFNIEDTSNLALVTSVTDTSEQSANPGRFAVDGDSATSWVSAAGGPQDLVVDLGGVFLPRRLDRGSGRG